MQPPSPSALSEATLSSPTHEECSRTEPSADNLTRDLFGDAKVSLDALTAAFEGLHRQTMQVTIPNGDAATKEGLDDLNREMTQQQQRHQDGIAEIQKILDDLLDKDLLEEFRDEIEREITGQIDEIVKEQVAECMKVHIPRGLRDEVDESKRELERARLALHNSESRRMNGKLRSDKPDEPLDTLLMSNGSVSAHFPKDLRALFNLDANACRALAIDYEFRDISDSRDINLNRFMQFCGVRYQLVRNLAT